MCFDSDIVDIPKKSACVDADTSDTSCHISKQDGKLDSISELNKLNLKIPDTLGSDINVIRSKLDVTAVHLSSASKPKPASDSSEKINIEMYGKLHECKTVEELCIVFDELSNIQTEHSLVCGTCFTSFSNWC